ncbi:MAG: sugar phosphate isomerase/epimerase [Defluviitaleaceae bacterium]|nr:sugar phosphate isomerase/epimerase [Defluviitaleaceae bacterium]MCL2835430.1 sugar phosphate isomerase/epimerase [Defluviitaleaceae bacterium]
MPRPVTLFTGQWADLPFEEACKLIGSMGYDGAELATWGDHMDVHKAASDPAYVAGRKEILEKYGLKCWAISGHLTGQCVGDLWDPRLDGFAPASLAGKPEEIRKWAIEEVKMTARAAAAMGCKVVTGFMGSPIWKYWYSFPQTTEAMVEEGFDEIVRLWTPIFDVFDEVGVKFALEVHPTEIAFDYWTTKKLFGKFKDRPTLGINYDPSHLLWNMVDPLVFARDFAEKIYHVHVKDVKLNLDGRNGILGSHIEFGNTRRGWNFVSPGHGAVDFDGIIRELNQAGYEGPLSVEWEDSGMERVFGATEACAFIRRLNFSASNIAFDSALAKE